MKVQQLNKQVQKQRKGEPEVPNKSVTGHVSKDTDNAGRVGTGEDTKLAGQADGQEFMHNPGKARQVGTDNGRAGQAKQDKPSGGLVDEGTSTQGVNLDAIPETTSGSANSGKRKRMELRRR